LNGLKLFKRDTKILRYSSKTHNLPTLIAQKEQELRELGVYMNLSKEYIKRHPEQKESFESAIEFHDRLDSIMEKLEYDKYIK
jgi:hypothetical protein